MELGEIKSFIEKKLSKKLPTYAFLNKMRVIDEISRKSFAYNDTSYIPLYYWLGTILKTEVLVEIGFKLGLISGNFLKACKTVKQFLAFQEANGEFYSCRLGRGNVKDVYKKEMYIHVGSVNDELFEIKLRSLQIDLAIINEEVSYDKYRLYFDSLWAQMSVGGILLVDCLKKHKPAGIAFTDFCVSQNIQPTYISTTYGVGLIKKLER